MSLGKLQHYKTEPQEPVEPAALPPEPERFLQTKDIACLMHETNQGTVFVVKLPATEIATLHGRVPVHIRHELYQHPKAPVIRTVIRIYDRLDNPLGLKTLRTSNRRTIGADFLRLVDQDQVFLLFYDKILAASAHEGD